MWALWIGIGIAIGIAIRHNWDNITDLGGQIADRLPDSTTIMEKAPVAYGFIKKHLLVILLVAVLVGVVAVNVIPKAPEIPVVTIGQPIEMYDACGAKQIVTVTEQDVARGSIAIGAIQTEGDKKDCRRILNLGTSKGGTK